jgi:futalosine hydrolase
MATSGVLGLRAVERCLLVIASGLEAGAVLRGLGGLGTASAEVLLPAWRLIPVGERFDVVVTGVGKANAAAGVAQVLNPTRHTVVLSVGIGGALPSASPPAIGICVLGRESVYADEGVPMPDGSFSDIAALGFAPNAGTGAPASMGVAATARVAEALRPWCDREGVIATVSECSGTDARAAEVVRRTGADVEVMEGAAVGFTVARLGRDRVGFAEVRVVSNTTGNRDRQQWDFRAALARLERFAAVLS